MNNNMTKGHLKILKDNFEKGCNGYLNELLYLWELSSKDGFWIANEVGGLYAHGETIFINMAEIIFCVENNVSMETYMDYSDYCLKCKEYNFNIPNLPSYFKGCPTVPQETFDRLDDLKRQMNECINDTKSKF